MSNIKRIGLALLVLGVGIGGFAYLKATKPEKPVTEIKEKVWLVNAIPATVEDIKPFLTLYGVAESPDLLRLAAPGAGVVEHVAVHEGDRVEKGAPLIQMSAHDFLPAVEQAKADVAELTAQLQELALKQRNDKAALANEKRLLAIADSALKRAQQLRKKNLSSHADLEKAEDTFTRQQLAYSNRQLAVNSYTLSKRGLTARRDKAQAMLNAAQTAFQRSQAIAPFNGVIAKVSVSQGDQVGKGNILLELYPDEQLELRARIPNRYVAALQAALEQGDVLRAMDRQAATPLSFQLLRLSGASQANGVDALFRVTSVRHVRPGEVLELELEQPIQTNVIKVPIAALYGNNRLYVVRDNRLKGINVQQQGMYRDEAGALYALVKSDAIVPGEPLAITHLPNAITGLKVQVAEQ